MTAEQNPEYGLFARTLKDLMEETVFDSHQWAYVLGVSERAISQWLSDIAIPRPDHLLMIVEIIEGSGDKNPETMRNFEQMAILGALDVSPHGSRMLPTVGEYLHKKVEGYQSWEVLEEGESRLKMEWFKNG